MTVLCLAQSHRRRPLDRMAIDRSVGRADLAEAVVVRPPDDHSVQAFHHHLGWLPGILFAVVSLILRQMLWTLALPGRVPI